jgi:large subunit ribosomal protein L22
MLPAPQGRAYRLRKRSNHVTVIVDIKNNGNVQAQEEIITVENETPEVKAAPVKKKAAKKAATKKSAPKAKAAKSKKTTKK